MSISEPKWSFGQKFYTDFNVTAAELATRVDALRSSDNEVGADTVQAVTLDLSLLTKRLSDATGSLPSYDQRQCELQLNALEKSVEELRGSLASATKFSFKRKTAKPKPSTERVEPPSEPLPKPVKPVAAYTQRYLTALDVRSQTSAAEISISDMDNCIVNLLPDKDDQTVITAVHVQRLRRSVVLLPRIAGSIILLDLSQCVIVVGCHQFRMHASTAIDVYLESGSDPILEHCSCIRFATYPGNQENQSLAVKDFSHILPTPSPNWSALPAGERDKLWPVSPLQDQALQDALDRLLPR